MTVVFISCGVVKVYQRYDVMKDYRCSYFHCLMLYVFTVYGHHAFHYESVQSFHFYGDIFVMKGYHIFTQFIILKYMYTVYVQNYPMRTD
jgi:hypothetical protein